MKLPNGEHAQISDRKLREYILSPTHPEGRQHALLFARLLGITGDNARVLRDALVSAAAQGDAVLGRSSAYGTKYEIRFPMRGPRGTYIVLSVWITPRGGMAPQLVTAYIE